MNKDSILDFDLIPNVHGNNPGLIRFKKVVGSLASDDGFFRIMKALSFQEFYVVCLIYGIYGKGMRRSDLATALDLSTKKLVLIEARAIRKLRHPTRVKASLQVK